MDLLKLTEVKILYENKMKEYVAEIKKLDAKSKAQAVQLDSVLKKIAGSPAPGARNSENHSKQLEQASIRVAETTKELNDKKKEVIQLKQENSKLASKIADLEKKIAHFGKKVA